MIDTKYLTDALAALGAKRRVLKFVLCRHRDRCVADGEHDMALVWNSLAVTIAEIEDHERLTLAAMEQEFMPGSERLS